MYGSDNPRPLTSQLQLRGGVEVLAIAADLQLDNRSAQMLRIDGGAADRAVKMPAGDREGVPFWIANVGATNALNLQDSTGAPITGATAALAPSQAALVAYTGSAWVHFGIYAITL